MEQLSDWNLIGCEIGGAVAKESDGIGHVETGVGGFGEDAKGENVPFDDN